MTKPCPHGDIANMDWIRGYPPETEPMMNRVCVKCWQHWAGPVGAVVEYTRSEWDARIATALDD